MGERQLSPAEDMGSVLQYEDIISPEQMLKWGAYAIQSDVDCLVFSVKPKYAAVKIERCLTQWGDVVFKISVGKRIYNCRDKNRLKFAANLTEYPVEAENIERDTADLLLEWRCLSSPCPNFRDCVSFIKVT